MFINFFKFMLALAFCLPMLSHAQTSYKATYSSAERFAIAEWIKGTTKTKVTSERGKRYVDQTYLQAFAKELDPLVLLAMMKVESGFMDKAKSHMGAVGLLQVIPRWHKDKLQGRNPMNYQVSIEVGSQVYKDCLNKWKKSSRKAFACYSGGAKNYENKVMTVHKELVQVLASAKATKEPDEFNGEKYDYFGINQISLLVDASVEGPTSEMYENSFNNKHIEL